jgi:hypothetical protein
MEKEVGFTQSQSGRLGREREDRQCTYYVTLRRVRETLVAVEKQ